MRRVQRRKRRILAQPSRLGRRLPAWLGLPAALVFGFALGTWAPGHWPAALGDDPLVVSRLSVMGARRVAPDELAAAAGVAPGTAFRDLDPAAIAKRVSAHPWIAAARATRLAPDVLLLGVTEREPVALAWLGVPPRPWLVARDGTPFVPATGTEGYPRLLGVAEFEAETPHAVLAQGVRLVESLVARRLPVPREIVLGGDDPRALPAFSLPTSNGDKRVIVGGSGDLEGKLERLVRLLEAARPETAAASVLDLRFGEQVILRSLPSSTEDGTAEARGGALPPATGRAG
jgi:cell division septal protein FtsQ